MKLSETLNGALNQQVLHEYRNMLIYKQVESFFENLQLKNIAKYFFNQSQHEKDHGDKFVKYINDRTGGNVSLESIQFPDISFDGIGSIANIYTSTEEETTASIEELYDLALNEKSFLDLDFLQEMLKEQVEEEDEAQHFAKNVTMVKDLVLFDKTFED